MRLIGNAAAGLSLAALAALLWLWQPAFVWRMPGADRIAVAVAACLLWLSLCVWARRGRGRKPPESASGTVAVVYASQTGSAERLANQTVSSLEAGGIGARLIHLRGLDSAALPRSATEAVLFVVSTTGEGEPPDDARAFVEALRRTPAAVRDLQGGGTTWQGYQIFLRFRAPSLEEAGFASPPYEEIDCEGMAARMAIPESIDSPFEPPWSPGVGPRATCWQADEIRTEWTHLGTHRVLFDGHVVHFVGSGS